MRKVRVDSFQSNAAASDCSQCAKLEGRQKGLAEFDVRPRTKKSFALRHANDLRLGKHIQPAKDTISLGNLRRQARAIAIENVNCVPHGVTERAHSIWVPSEMRLY